MIKIDMSTSKPDNIQLIVETEEEQDFVNSNFPQIFDKFIQSRSPYKSTQEYLDDVHNLYEANDSKLDLNYKWNKLISTTKNLMWKDWVVKDLEDTLNNEFKVYKGKK